MSFDYQFRGLLHYVLCDKIPVFVGVKFPVDEPRKFYWLVPNPSDTIKRGVSWLIERDYGIPVEKTLSAPTVDLGRNGRE